MAMITMMRQQRQSQTMNRKELSPEILKTFQKYGAYLPTFLLFSCTHARVLQH